MTKKQRIEAIHKMYDTGKISKWQMNKILNNNIG